LYTTVDVKTISTKSELKFVDPDKFKSVIEPLQEIEFSGIGVVITDPTKPVDKDMLRILPDVVARSISPVESKNKNLWNWYNRNNDKKDDK
jgi:hypothetical protein